MAHLLLNVCKHVLHLNARTAASGNFSEIKNGIRSSMPTFDLMAKQMFVSREGLLAD